MRNLIQYTQDVKIPWRRELTQGEFEQLFEISKTHKYGIMEAISIAYRAGFKSGTTMMNSKMKAARVEKGITISDLAEAVGTSSEAIGDYEDGSRVPRDSLKTKIAEALGKPVPDLFF